MQVGRPLLGLGLTALVAAAGLIWFVVAGSGRPTPTSAQPGSAAPTLHLPLLDGGSADLAQQHGKVVLINFWATWCEPCRNEMAGLQQLDHRLSADQFALYPVDMEETATAITPFREQIGFTLPVLLDSDGSASHSYGVRALPSTFIIDQSGTVREQHLGPLVDGDAATPWSQAWVEARVRELLGS